MRRLAGLLAGYVIGLAATAPVKAAPFVAALPSLSPGAQCRAAIDRAERAYRLPVHLLAAIGRVESGRTGPGGRVDPWPYSINVEGAGRVFDTKLAAIAGVRAQQARGARSIDVGCMQVNLMYHPDAFASLEEAFDPVRNADYAARFLVRLREQTGSWEAATAAYHSATAELGQPYAAKVRAARASEAGSPGLQPLLGPTRQPPLGRIFHAGVASALPPPRLMPMLGGGGAAGTRTGLGTGRGLAEYRINPVRLVPPVPRR